MGKSRADRAYDALLTRVVSGELPVGATLSETELAAELAVSRTPIREAALRLERDGLVERRGRRLTVAGLSYSQAAEIYVARAALEAMATRLAAVAATDEQLAGLAEVVDASREALAAGDLARLAELNLRFHSGILELSGSGLLCELARRFKARIQRHRRAAVVSFGRAPRAVAAHQAILDVIRRRDPDEAEAAMRNHVLEAGAVFLTMLEMFFGRDRDTPSAVVLRRYLDQARPSDGG